MRIFNTEIDEEYYEIIFKHLSKYGFNPKDSGREMMVGLPEHDIFFLKYYEIAKSKEFQKYYNTRMRKLKLDRIKNES